jgi:hypothetical protein
VELAGIILASAAFVVAGVSLYLGNLRRADIEISLPGRPWMSTHQRRHEGLLISAELNVPLVVTNLGARPGVMTWIDVVRPATPFYAVEWSHPTNPNWRDGATGVFPLLSGESQVMTLAVGMGFPEEAVKAWRDGQFRSFEVVVTYSFRRGRRFRPTATRKYKVEVPVDTISASLE